MTETIAAIARGELVVVVDDQNRENEGDLVMAAEKVTPATLAFMVRHSSGVVCVPMPAERLEALRLAPMVPRNTEAHETAFTVSTDFRPGTTTGISAADRAATIHALLDSATSPDDLARPGNVFPLRAQEGGVLSRAGHTEAATDLARLAGLYPAGVICELVNDDGTMPDRRQLESFAREHGLAMTSVAALAQHRLRSERLTRPVAEARLPTRHGVFRAHVFQSLTTGVEHLALVLGEPASGEPLVRVHSECLTGEALGSTRCDCGTQLDLALERISAEGHGVLVYLRGHEGRGIGLGHKLRAYALQDEGLDTVDANLELGFPADGRRYGVAAQILRALGVSSVRLMTNNPAKRIGLEEHGVTVAERMELVAPANEHNVRYLEAKRRRLGHLLELDLSIAT